MTTETLARIDREALRRKYAEERDKRLRPDGNDQYGLYSDVLFHTEVTALSWDEAGARWVIETSRGDWLTAQFVVLGTGPLSVPKLPGIPGIGSFRGHSFHTSRWDYDYTGGDYEGQGCPPMDKLADQRVGLIGTGATAVQCVPYLVRDARELRSEERRVGKECRSRWSPYH